MPKLQQTLFIARSKESAELFLSSNKGAARSLTLDALLGLEEFSTLSAMDSLIAKTLLRQAVKELCLEHFDYLYEAVDSIGEIYAHIVACKSNGVGFDAFDYDSKKLAELLSIQEAYESLKSSMGLFDTADVLLQAVKNLKSSRFFESFSEIVIDSFVEDEITFYQNAAQKELLAFIASLPNAKSIVPVAKEETQMTSFTPLQSRFDEAIFAIKAARKLMEEGKKADEIAIVVGSLGSYRLVLESNAVAYGMKLRFSSGFPLLQSPLLAEYLSAKSFESFQDVFKARLQNDLDANRIEQTSLEVIKQEFLLIKNLHKRSLRFIQNAQELFGLKHSFKEVAKELAKESYVPPLLDEGGVFVCEPNQLTLRAYDSIIFIGSDLAVFPPKAKGSFLATLSQKEVHLGANNFYKLSQYYFKQLQKHSQNLHVATALFDGKKKLFLSPIISNVAKNSFEGAQFASEREYLLNAKRFSQNEAFETYARGFTSPESTLFDGKASAHAFDIGILSATKLNEYAKCPLRFMFTHVYKLEPFDVKREDDALEASDIGNIFHSIAQIFAEDVKAKRVTLGDAPSLEVKKHLEQIAQRAHAAYVQKEIVEKGKVANVFHEIVLLDLLKGLYDMHHERGLLIRFLEYVYESDRLECFNKSEERFLLDANFEITSDEQNAIVKGFVDRIDTDEEQKLLRVIDYKTGKYAAPKEKKLIEKMAAFEEFQLTLYMLYAKQAYGEYAIDAYLLSIRHKDGTKEYAHMSSDEQRGLLYDESYARGLKETITRMKRDMEAGSFAMTPSPQNCEYCPYEKICHKSVLPHKWVENESLGDEDE